MDPVTLLLCTCPAKTLPLHPTPRPSALAFTWVGMLFQFLPRAATCWQRVALQHRTLAKAEGGQGLEEDHLKSKM